MPEVIVSPAPTPTAPTTPPTPTDGLYAGGKIKGPEALEKATREIVTKLELSPLPDGPLFGDGKPFKDVTALEAHYLAHEKILGRLSNTPKVEEKPSASVAKVDDKLAQLPSLPDPKAAVDDDMDLEGVTKSAGLDWAVVEKQFEEKGELTSEQYAAYKAKGYPKKVVNQIAANAKVAKDATVARVVAQLDEIAGGRESRDRMLEWAGTFYQATERDAINRGIKNPNTAVQTMKVIESDFRKNARGADSRPIISGGTPPASPVVGPYTDPAEYRAILNKPNPTAEEAARFAATNANILQRWNP